MFAKYLSLPPVQLLFVSILLPSAVFLLLLSIESVLRKVTGYPIRDYSRTGSAIVASFAIIAAGAGMASALTGISFALFPGLRGDLQDFLPLYGMLMYLIGTGAVLGISTICLKAILQRLPESHGLTQQSAPSVHLKLGVIGAIGLLLWLVLSSPGDPTESPIAHVMTHIQAPPFRPVVYGLIAFSILWLAGIMVEADVTVQSTISSPKPRSLEDIPALSRTHNLGFESPIEKMFWDEWQRRGGTDTLDLTYQYNVPDSSYRIDFVHLPTKTAIELDGYEYHSSKEQFTHDRKRQRELERLGWRFVRFSGSEINRSSSQCFNEVVDFIKTLDETSVGNNQRALASSETLHQARTQDEIYAKLTSIIDGGVFDLTTIGNKTWDEMTLDEFYLAAAQDIAFNREMSRAIGLAGVGMEDKAWVTWVNKLEEMEKRDAGAEKVDLRNSDTAA